MTKAVKAAGGFEYMKEHGVYHEPDKPPLYFSYSRKVPASSLTADGVIFDEAAQVYWNWHKLPRATCTPRNPTRATSARGSATRSMWASSRTR
jgi:hypothetical protein